MALGEKDFALFNENFLFNGLSTKQLEKLHNAAKEIILEPGIYLIHEGDVPNEIYFVLEGSLEVVKYDDKHQVEHVIAPIHAGETLGEMAIIDTAPRSASVRSTTKVRLLCIMTKEYQQITENNPQFSFSPLSKNLVKRLRDINALTLKILQKQIDDYKLQVMMGNVVFMIIVSFCLFIFGFKALISIQQAASLGTIVTGIFTSLLVIAFLYLFKSSHFPLKTFGITTHNWKKAVKESMIFFFIATIILLLTKWLAIKTVPSFSHHQLFEPYIEVSKLAENGQNNLLVSWVSTLVLYTFVIAPLQELITRGGLQSALQIFFIGKYKTMAAILASNLMFSAFHLYISTQMSIMAFLLGISLGWLYSRHQTLIGVILAHAILGGIGWWVIGSCDLILPVWVDVLIRQSS